MTFTPIMKRLIAGWREMAGKWCMNRTVAEVHSFAYLSAKPLNGEEVASALSLSRSIAGANLRELENLRLINSVRLRDYRKQYYESTQNPWEVFHIILDDQKRRVVAPTVAAFKA